MPLYEHVFIARQDLASAQAESLIEHFGTVLADNGGKVVMSDTRTVRFIAPEDPMGPRIIDIEIKYFRDPRAGAVEEFQQRCVPQPGGRGQVGSGQQRLD